MRSSSPLGSVVPSIVFARHRPAPGNHSQWAPRPDREKATDLAGKYGSYGELKNDCAEAVVGLLRSIQQRYRDLGAEGVMKTVLRDGATRAAELAEAKLRLAKANAGLFAP
jgi:hypothetical protein